ncbi:hypothetical protein BDV96DRAFT_647326 [Lophiotrema nucula]|uniref:Uncharacterized protein n=1 Tax=Lophiotrema nucula TaxID=690887 RepID=A0A6A5Z5B5_9PLEO|nr:hypothetical protein BDV96DRAFT_647326 [Lophiotrema nucula]
MRLTTLLSLLPALALAAPSPLPSTSDVKYSIPTWAKDCPTDNSLRQFPSWNDYSTAARNACGSLLGPSKSFTATERGFRRVYFDVGTYLSTPKAPKTRPMSWEIWRRSEHFSAQVVPMELCTHMFTYLDPTGAAGKQDVCVVQRSDGVKELLVRGWKSQSSQEGFATLDFEVYPGIL